MITDGNLISKGVNEGEAIALQPWQADPNIVSQAIAAGREKKKEKEAEEKAQKKQMEDFQAQLLEDYKYNPLDAKVIKKFQDEAVEAIKNYRPGDDPLELKLKIQRLKIAKNDSYNTFVEGNKMMQQINKEKDTNYIEGLDDWTKSQVENDAADLDAFGANIAKREAARLGVYAGQKKIDSIPKHIYEVGKIIPITGTYTTTEKDKYGDKISVVRNTYSDDAIDNFAEVDYKTHERALKEAYPTVEDYKEAVRQTLKPVGRTQINMPPVPKNLKSGGWTIGSGSATNGNLTISAPIEYDIREKSIDKEYENYLKTASRSGSETFTKNEYRDWYNKTRPAQKGLFYPLTSTRQAGEYPAIDVELSDGSHINASPVAQNEDGTQLLVKTKSGDFITAPTDKNQTFYNKHKTSSGQVSQITQNWGNDDIQISTTGGTGAAPTTKQEVAKGNAKNAAAQKKYTAPKVGEVRGGYKFLGGDPKDSKNWQKI